MASHIGRFCRSIGIICGFEVCSGGFAWKKSTLPKFFIESSRFALDPLRRSLYLTVLFVLFRRDFSLFTKCLFLDFARRRTCAGLLLQGVLN
jgi:hypothetical protein